MAREYQVKINVDSTKAEAALAKFEQKANRTFDKLNKTSFQPTAFINGINVSIQKVMQLAVKEQEAAAKIAQANAKVEEAHKKVVESNNKVAEAEQKSAQAKEKTAQAEQKTAQETAKAQAKIAQSYNKALAEYHKVEQAQKKVQAEHVKGLAKVGAEELRVAAIQEKVRTDYIKGLEKQQQKAEETRLKEAKLDLEYEKMASKFILEQQKMSSTAKQGSSEIISSHQAVADNFSRVTGQMTNAWNQLKMVVGFAGVAGMLRSALTEMKSMSDELITYQKVTGASSEQVAKVRASAYQSAGRYGQTPSDFLASVATMARAGYDEQSEAMADLATKTQLVGDMTSEAASKFLIAVDAGYQLKGNIEELSSVLDKANIIDNNYATSLSKVADAMTLIAPLSASMNVSIEETMAAIGTMSAVTQREGTEVARAYRMIALNIAKDTETEVEEGVKLTEEEIKSLNDILQVYAATELKAADAAGKLLSPMKAIEAISRAWKSGALNEQELFKVLNGIGGARYTNSIMALVKNFDMYEDMLSKFVTEMGSADAEVTAMTQGWTAKFNQLKVAWTEMVNNAISEDFIRQLLDIAKGFVQFTGNLQNFTGIAGGAVIALKALSAGLKSLAGGGSFGAGSIVGVAAGAFLALASAVRAYNQQAKAAKEASYAKSIEDAAKAASSEYDKLAEISEIIAEYKKLTEDGVIDQDELESAKTLQGRLKTLVGETAGAYDLVNGKIADMKGLLNEALWTQQEISMEAAQTARQEARSVLVRKATDTESGIFGETGGVNVSLGLENKDIAAIAAVYRYIKENPNSNLSLNESSPNVLGAFALAWGSTVTGQYDWSQFSDLYGTAFRGDQAATISPASITSADDVVAYVNTLKEVMAILREEAGPDGVLSDTYFAIKEIVDEYEPYIAALEDAEERVTSIQKRAYETVSGGGTEGGESGTDGEAESWDRLAKSIKNATKAKEDFDEANKTTKADQINDYASVYATLAEELKNGRVNSTAAHAALQMLLGDEAYAATGGRVQALQEAWTGKRAGQMLSAAESYEILTGTYQNQNGQTVEGAGIAVLAEKVGMEVRDELGNYMLDFTDTAKLEELSALTGVTVDALRSALNAYDQYDITGTSTGAGHPQEQDGVKTAEEANTDAVTAQTTATEQNTAAVQALTATIAAQGGAEEGETSFLSTGNASTTPKKASHSNIHPAHQASYEYEKDIAEADGNIVVKTPEGSVIINPSDPTFGNDLGKQVLHSLIKPKSVAEEADTVIEKGKADAEAVDTAAAALALVNLVDNLKYESPEKFDALDYWQNMLIGHRTGDFSGYNGEEDIEGDYLDYKEMYGENVGSEIAHRASEAAILAGVKPIIDKYDLDTVLQSLDQELNKEAIPVVIDTVLNKYSLEEVLASLDMLSGENRTAVINAAIAKYGKEAVIAELKRIATNNGGGWAAEILAELDSGSEQATKKKLNALTAPETKKIYTRVITSGAPAGVQATAHEAVGSSSYHGGAALVNDGTGAELVLDSHGAHVYGGGSPTVANIERGAMIYTAEQTRSLIASVPHHATGNEANAAAQLAAELNAFFDYIRTGDTSYTLAGSGSSSGGGSSSAKANADSQWDSLKELIEYIIKRLGKALEAQQKVIDEQISALQAQKSQQDQQNQIEELQKAVAEAQANLAEAQSQRSVRYIDDNGQWHWMADQKKVQQAQEELDKANKSFVDYLYDVSIDAQVKALEDEKTRLSDEYTGYKDLWSDILDAVATPTGDLVALIQYLTANGTGAQRNGAAAVRDQLITAMLGGSYSANYNEALGEIGKAAANNPSVPGISDAALAALIASSGTSVSSGAMLGALQSIAGNNAAVGSVGGSVANNDNSVQYFINGVQIGSNMANMPLSEILQRLSVYANASL